MVLSDVSRFGNLSLLAIVWSKKIMKETSEWDEYDV